MSPVNEVRRRGARTSAPDFWAVALILKVAAMQQITDIYGPIPYSQYGNGGATVPYDSQQAIYTRFFAELDTASTNLKQYIAAKPGLKPYFEVSTVSPGKYIGIRAGSNVTAKNDYIKFSDISLTNFTQTTPYQWMTAAEVYFLRAEGALRKWNMGGTPQQLYEAGITTSLTQWGVAGSASTYINDGTSVPTSFVDPLYPDNSAPARSGITIKWDDGASDEQKLERIITQKWIATFPDCTTAWSTFRRTGYPKLFPVAINSSGGTVNTDIQIRRMSYPLAEERWIFVI